MATVVVKGLYTMYVGVVGLGDRREWTPRQKYFIVVLVRVKGDVTEWM